MYKKVLFLSVSFLLLAYNAVAASPENVQTLEAKDAAELHARGYELQLQGDVARAQFFYERAKALDPDNAQLLNDLGLVYEASGHADLAEEHYLKAIAADYKCLPAYTNLGYLYKNKKNYDLAIRYFESRVKYGDPRDEWTLKAQAELEGVIDASPTLRKKRIQADKQALENELALRAQEVDQVNVREKNMNIEMDYQRGMRLFAQRRYEAAQAAFEKCLREDAGNKDARHMLERLKALLAKKPVTRETGPHSDQGQVIADMEYDKGLRLMRDGYRDEAVKAFDRALAFSPADPDILDALARAKGE